MNFGNNQTLEYYENFISQRDNEQKERENRVKQGEKKKREQAGAELCQAKHSLS